MLGSPPALNVGGHCLPLPPLLHTMAPTRPADLAAALPCCTCRSPPATTSAAAATFRLQPFKKILEVPYVKRVIEEADGIQPHLVAPEAGYRRLLEEALGYLKDPTEKSVEEVRRGAAVQGAGRGGAIQGVKRGRGWQWLQEGCHLQCPCP